MSYLSVRTRGTAAVTICPRCQMKMHYDDLVQDPNNRMWVCKDCCDEFDPWRKAQRGEEDINLMHPRPDVKLENPDL